MCWHISALAELQLKSWLFRKWPYSLYADCIIFIFFGYFLVPNRSLVIVFLARSHLALTSKRLQAYMWFLEPVNFSWISHYPIGLDF
jgi:hypothetical protein